VARAFRAGGPEDLDGEEGELQKFSASDPEDLGVAVGADDEGFGVALLW
jgi:hypothetical protein